MVEKLSFQRSYQYLDKSKKTLQNSCWICL